MDNNAKILKCNKNITCECVDIKKPLQNKNVYPWIWILYVGTNASGKKII